MSDFKIPEVELHFLKRIFEDYISLSGVNVSSDSSILIYVHVDIIVNNLGRDIRSMVVGSLCKVPVMDIFHKKRHAKFLRVPLSSFERLNITESILRNLE
jgi:hypothetical protein